MPRCFVLPVIYCLRSHQSNDFRVIQLDEARLQKPEGIREFRFLLRKLRKSDAAEIVWLSDDFPQMDYLQAEDEEKAKDKGKTTARKSATVSEGNDR